MRDSSCAVAWRMPVWLAIPILVAATLIAYSNSFFGVFLLDDFRNIVNNEALRDADALSEQLTRSGRPLLYLSLAVNYRLGGLNTFGYHLFNLAVHLTAGLALFGCVRRTLAMEGVSPRFQERAVAIACVSALLWLVHPLQTGAVTYIVQRCESMMGMFFLLTLYAVIRGAASQRAWAWYAAAVLFAACGMGSKEVMVTAAVVIPLYDRIFLSRSWREVAVRRGWVYGFLLLLAAWWLVPALVPRPKSRAATAGFQYAFMTPWQYLRSQPGVILYYLRLAFWPDRLCLDYAWPVARSWQAIVWPGLAMAGLLGLTVLGLWRRPRLGFLGAAFFLILAPTSSIMPIQDLAFEHRMYLPLAAVVVLATLAGMAILPHISPNPRMRTLVAGAVAAYLAFALTARTIERNRDYRSAARMWDQVIAVAPHNARAYANRALAVREEDPESAIEFARKSLAMNAHYVPAWSFLGRVLGRQNEPEEAMAAFRQALAIDPDRAPARHGLSQLLAQKGEYSEAVEQLRMGMAAQPNASPIRARLAWLLATAPDPSVRDGDEAVQLALGLQRSSEPQPRGLVQRVLRAACGLIVRQGPVRESPATLDVLAAAYAEAGQFAEAVETARRAVEAARTAGHAEQAEEIGERLRLYEQGLPYRDRGEQADAEDDGLPEGP